MCSGRDILSGLVRKKGQRFLSADFLDVKKSFCDSGPAILKASIQMCVCVAGCSGFELITNPSLQCCHFDSCRLGSADFELSVFPLFFFASFSFTLYKYDAPLTWCQFTR